MAFIDMTVPLIWTPVCDGKVYLPGPGPFWCQPVFCSTQVTTSLYPPNAWNTLDLTPYLPPGEPIVAVELGGFLIITNGKNDKGSDTNLTMQFQTPPDGTPRPASGNYTAQTLGIDSTGGSRQQYSSQAVILSPSKAIQWLWGRGRMDGQYPSGNLQAWPQDGAYEVTISITKAYCA